MCSVTLDFNSGCSSYFIFTGPVAVRWLGEAQQIDPVIIILGLIAIPIFYNDKTDGKKIGDLDEIVDKEEKIRSRGARRNLR